VLFFRLVGAQTSCALLAMVTDRMIGLGWRRKKPRPDRSYIQWSAWKPQAATPLTALKALLFVALRARPRVTRIHIG